MTEADLPRMSPRDLYQAMRKFIDDNKHSRNVDFRWLCKHIEVNILEEVADVGNGKLPPDTEEKVNAFRSMEICSEINRKRREVEVLERELKTLATKAA